MKNSICMVFLIISVFSVSAQKVLEGTYRQIKSPDGRYIFSTYQKKLGGGAKQLYYTVTYNGKQVIEESELGVLIENGLFESALGIPNGNLPVWEENLNLTDSRTNSVNETWYPVYGERNTIRNHFNELTLQFMKGEEKEGEQEGSYDKRRYYLMDFIVRVYNEGVAFRYPFPEATNGLFLHIVGEQTQFTLPEGTMAYYERWAQRPYSLLPIKKWKDECERPLTMKLENGLTVALTEAAMVNYARMKFRPDEKKLNTLRVSLYSSVDVITPYSTPRRVIMAAGKATELIENNDIILNLNPENRIHDISWIKPGKVIRVGSLKQEDAIKCIYSGYRKRPEKIQRV